MNRFTVDKLASPGICYDYQPNTSIIYRKNSFGWFRTTTKYRDQHAISVYYTDFTSRECLNTDMK